MRAVCVCAALLPLTGALQLVFPGSGRGGRVATCGTGKLAAQQQKRAFYALAPWEKQKYVFPWTDTTSAVVANVYASQAPWLVAGEPPPEFSLNPTNTVKERWRDWKLVGRVAAATEDLFPEAIAFQRELIEDWAFALCEGGALTRVSLTRREPVYLAWGYGAKLGSFEKTLQPTWAGRRLPVPNGLKCTAESAQSCGFVGVPTRASLGSKRFMMLENIEL